MANNKFDKKYKYSCGLYAVFHLGKVSNSCEEVRPVVSNAMMPLAELLDMVLQGNEYSKIVIDIYRLRYQVQKVGHPTSLLAGGFELGTRQT